MLTPTGLRLFIAAEVPDAVRSEAAGLRARWEQRLPGARWTKPEGIHLTLKFLGGTEEARLPAVIGVLTAHFVLPDRARVAIKTGAAGMLDGLGKVAAAHLTGADAGFLARHRTIS